MGQMRDLIKRYTGLDVVTGTEAQRLTQTQAAARKRAFEAGFDTGRITSGNDEPPDGTLASYGYSRMKGRGVRNFDELEPDQIINTVWKIFASNGTAKRALHLEVDHVLGHNPTIAAPNDPVLQDHLDDFVSANKFVTRLRKFLITRSLFGELCLPVFIRATDGRVKLGYVDPASIEHVVTHPRNPLEQWAVITKQDESGHARIYRIIREDEGAIMEGPDGTPMVIEPTYPGRLVTDQQAMLTAWEAELLRANRKTGYDGSCFYFDKNNITNQPRGYSDLLQSADPLDMRAAVLYALGEREDLASYYSWDVALEDSGPEVVEARRQEIAARPPIERGAVNVHNSEESWSFNYPDLKQPGSVSTSQELKTEALQGLKQPRHWHGEDDTANRATAESADNPVNKMLETEQADVKGIILEVLEFARDQAIIAGSYRPATPAGGPDPEAITVNLPVIVKKQIDKIADTLGKVAQAVALMRVEQLISHRTAALAAQRAMAELGIEYDLDEELAKIDMENGGMGLEAPEESALESLLEGINLNGSYYD